MNNTSTQFPNGLLPLVFPNPYYPPGTSAEEIERQRAARELRRGAAKARIAETKRLRASKNKENLKEADMLRMKVIQNLSERDRQKFLRDVNNEELALAVQGENETLIDSLTSVMSEQCAADFREHMKKAAEQVEAETAEAEKSDDEGELVGEETPASVTSAREKVLAAVTKLAEDGDIAIPEVLLPGISADFKEWLGQTEDRMCERIEEVQRARALIRKHILSEAEKISDEKLAQVSGEILADWGSDADIEGFESIFRSELGEFIDGFFARHVLSDDGHGSAHKALLAIGETARRKILANLTLEHEDKIRRALEKDSITFDTLLLLDDRSIQKMLREVDSETLAKSLKLATSEVQEKIFRNMSKRAAAMLKEDMEFMSPVRKVDVYEAQDKITGVINRLETDGEIVIARPGEEEDFV